MMNEPTMEVPPDQRNLQQNLNIMASQGRVAAADGNMMMDEDSERMDDNEREGADDERDGADDSGSRSSDPWFMRSFWTLGRSMVPSGVSSSGSSSPSYEGREEDMSTEREGGGDSYNERIHEPLKRGEARFESQGNKRRRVGADASRVFFQVIPDLTERQQAIVEYTAPAGLTPLFFFLGYTPFAVGWVVVMYVSHFIQTMLSTFGDETPTLRIRPWIPPLIHHLIDTYVWNHSMITMMLLFPEMFGTTAYWLAVFFVMGQQQCYLVVSLKIHYMKHKHTLTEQARRLGEYHLMDTFLLYALADLAFVLSRLIGMPSLLYIGLVEFNLAPLYLVWAHKQRMDAGRKPSTTKKPDQKKEEAEKDTKKDN
jgi:hypothetical protein